MFFDGIRTPSFLLDGSTVCVHYKRRFNEITVVFCIELTVCHAGYLQFAAFVNAGN